MIYVQHLLGIGHLQRASLLADALAQQGFEVDLVSGGMPVARQLQAGVCLHQLPPVRSLDGHFDRLVDADDRAIDDRWKRHRRETLLRLYQSLQPQALITETYPFGRRMMRFELLPLLQVARQYRPRPLIIASIRDILQPKSKPQRNAEILDLLECYYDRILVHGDPRFAQLADSFSAAGEVADKIAYTGYIADSKPVDNKARDGRGEVVVSGGGGAASLPLLECAIEAQTLSQNSQLIWRLLAGPNIGQIDFDRLKQRAGQGVIFERNRADFPTLLNNCAVSVSQAGYNTVVDILNLGARAVMVPFSDAGEIEQTLRARRLQENNRIVMLSEEKLTPEALAVSVDRAAKMPKQKLKLKMDGATLSARFLSEWLDAA